MANQSKRAVTNILADMALKDSKGAVIDVDNPKVKGNAEFDNDVNIAGELKLTAIDNVKFTSNEVINALPIYYSYEGEIDKERPAIMWYRNPELPSDNGLVFFAGLNNQGYLMLADDSDGGDEVQAEDDSFYIKWQPNLHVEDEYEVHLPRKNGTLAVVSDIPTYYKHFITLRGHGTDYILCFNAYSKSDTPVNNEDTLFLLFKNSTYMCNGKYNTLIPYSIHLGTNLATSTISGNGNIVIEDFDDGITDIVTPVN